MQDILKIDTLSSDLMTIPISWAKTEGWNPGLTDHIAFYAADNSGFLAGWYQEKVLATISAVNYSNRFAFIGFYIVDQKYRGKGYGRQIWNAALDKLQNTTIGLDGVVAQQDFYQRSGFRLAHRNIRFQGLASSFPPANLNSVTDSHFDSLVDYDALHFGYPRKNFLSAWIHQKHATTKALVTESRIRGYGVIRKCFEGYKIGPLFAENYNTAVVILQELISNVPEGESFFLDIPEPNLNALKLVQEQKMQAVFETARMYKGAAPKLPLDNIYGITTFELG